MKVRKIFSIIFLSINALFLFSCEEQKSNKNNKVEKFIKKTEYFYDGNQIVRTITSGIDNKVTKVIETYDDNHNLLKSYCETDGLLFEYVYNENNQKIYSKDNGGSGHEYFYEYDKNGDMVYFHSTIGGEPYLEYYAEYKNHKMVHRYNENYFGELTHEWWHYSDDFTKCTYENYVGDTEYLEFDLEGRKIYKRKPAEISESNYEEFYEYDEKGNLILYKTIMDGKESVIIYKYNDKNDKIYEKMGSYEEFYDYEYDDQGRIKTEIWRD